MTSGAEDAAGLRQAVVPKLHVPETEGDCHHIERLLIKREPETIRCEQIADVFPLRNEEHWEAKVGSQDHAGATFGSKT
jgi:hypothetical protein